MILLYIPFPTLKSAKRVGKILLKEGLVACVNVFKSSSLFKWKGKLKDVTEYVMIAKTREKLRAAVEKRVGALHPYELPAIITLRPSSANKKFEKWVSENTR